MKCFCLVIVITFAFYAGCGMHKEGHNAGNFLPH